MRFIAIGLCLFITGCAGHLNIIRDSEGTITRLEAKNFKGGVTASGDITADSFIGDGSSLTGISASAILEV